MVWSTDPGLIEVEPLHEMPKKDLRIIACDSFKDKMAKLKIAAYRTKNKLFTTPQDQSLMTYPICHGSYLSID